MLRCKACGGRMIFSVSKQALVCESCRTIQNVSDYDLDNDASESTYETNVYSCRRCGAQQTVTDDSLVCYCEYCGTEMMLRGRITDEKPAGIVPFTFGRKRAQNEYKKSIEHLWFVPKDYKDPQRLDEFRGIYIPYFGFGADVSGNVKARVTESRGSTRYVYDNVYKIENDGEYLQDASSKFSDAVSGSITPPDPAKNAIPFKEGYVAGFYADRSDIKPDIYIDDIKRRVREDVDKAIKGDVSNWNSVNISVKRPYSILLPVWFLTYRKRNRMAYVVQNGSTGKMNADIPVATGRFFLTSLLVSAIIFAALFFTLTMTAKVAMNLSMVLAMIIFPIFRRQLRKFRITELREDDIGYQFTKGRIIKIKDRKKRTGCITGCSSTMLVFLAVFMLGSYIIPLIMRMLTSLAGSGATGTGTVPAIPILAFVIIMIGFVSTVYSSFKTKRIRFFFIGLIFVAASFAAIVVTALNLPSDVYYYGITIATLTGTFLGTTQLISIYNLRTTHPMPGFYDREGGSHEAE